jgi:hypothetical protein
VSLWIVAALPLVILAITVAVVTTLARRKARARRPVKEASAFLLLEQNVWSACVVDDRQQPWERLATEPVRGFCGVPVGRHRVVTATVAGHAVLDVVALPGEILAFRLDGERARWEPCDVDGDTRAQLDGVPASTLDVNAPARHVRMRAPGWLVHLRTTLEAALPGEGRMTRPDARARADDEGFERLRKRFAKLVAAVDRASDGARGREEHEDGLREARALGEALVGKPLARRDIRALVTPARETAMRLLADDDSDRAMRVVALGLALLPGDPELTVVAGCVLAVRGETNEALRALDAALARDRYLEASDVARAMRARMELRTRLGLRVRV